MSQPPSSASIDRTERTGSPGLVLLLATLLVGAAAALSFLPQEQAGRLTIGLLALLAICGVVGLFAYAVGFLQMAGQSARNDVTQQQVEAIADQVAGLERGERRDVALRDDDNVNRPIGLSVVEREDVRGFGDPPHDRAAC